MQTLIYMNNTYTISNPAIFDIPASCKPEVINSHHINDSIDYSGSTGVCNVFYFNIVCKMIDSLWGLQGAVQYCLCEYFLKSCFMDTYIHCVLDMKMNRTKKNIII